MSDGSPTLTIKFGRDYDAPWFVASGSVPEMRHQLAEFSGVQLSDVDGLSLSQFAGQVAHKVQADWQIQSKLGGVVVPSGKSSKPAAKHSGKVATKPAAKPSAPTPEPEPLPEDDGVSKPMGDAEILPLFTAAQSQDELRDVLHAWPSEIKKSPALVDAYKGRMAELKKGN